jgi:hypothetical protein
MLRKKPKIEVHGKKKKNTKKKVFCRDCEYLTQICTCTRQVETLLEDSFLEPSHWTMKPLIPWVDNEHNNCTFFSLKESE